MPNCKICNNNIQSKFSTCTNCYSQKGTIAAAGNAEQKVKDPLKTKANSGLTNSFKKLKGKIAEAIIQELFTASGYKVYPFGIECAIPGIMEYLRTDKSEVSLQIRSMPDFVIYHPETGPKFIEVKFRKSGCYSLPENAFYDHYSNGFIILVSKEHIKCLSIEEIKLGAKFTPESTDFLANRSEFNLDPKLVINYRDMAKKFFMAA